MSKFFWDYKKLHEPVRWVQFLVFENFARAYLFQIAWQKLFDYLLIIHKWQFLSCFSILCDNNVNWWVKVNSLSPNHVWKLSSFFNSEKQSLLSVELKNLTTKQRKISLVWSFDALSCQMFFECLRNWAVFNAGKKLFNPAQVALSKIPGSKAKIYHNMDFLSSDGHLLTFPGCCPTLASSLVVVQVRFASWNVYHVLLGNNLSYLSAISIT